MSLLQKCWHRTKIATVTRTLALELKSATIWKNNNVPIRAGHQDLHLPDRVGYMPRAIGQSLMSYPALHITGKGKRKLLSMISLFDSCERSFDMIVLWIYIYFLVIAFGVPRTTKAKSGPLLWITKYIHKHLNCIFIALFDRFVCEGCMKAAGKKKKENKFCAKSKPLSSLSLSPSPSLLLSHTLAHMGSVIVHNLW